jgi:hypothetical protein
MTGRLPHDHDHDHPVVRQAAGRENNCRIFITYTQAYHHTTLEQTAHHILWECCLWHNERKLKLDSVMATSGAVNYSDLVATRANYYAFRQFCNTYHWTRTQKQLTH